MAEGLEPSVKKIAVAIADSDMSVQPLRCDTPGETHAVLKSVAVAAANSGYRVLALPATAAAAARAHRDRYSHTALAAAEGIAKLQSGRWKSPVGALVIVDDADHLTDSQLTWLMTHASATNTQVVLATSHEATHGPSRHLIDALAENLPWSVDRSRSAGNRSTAICRIRKYLNTIEHPETCDEKVAAELVARCEASVNRYWILRWSRATVPVVGEPGFRLGVGRGDAVLWGAGLSQQGGRRCAARPGWVG